MGVSTLVNEVIKLNDDLMACLKQVRSSKEVKASSFGKKGGLLSSLGLYKPDYDTIYMPVYTYEIKDFEGLAKVGEEIEDIVKEASENEKTYTEVKKRFEQWGYEDAKKIESSNDKLDEINKQINDLNMQIKGYEAQQQAIETQIEEDKSTVEDIQKKIDCCVNTRKDNTGWNWFTHWQNYVPGYNVYYNVDEIEKYKSDMGNYSSKINAFIMDIDQLNNKIWSNTNKLGEMQMQISDLSATVSVLIKENNAVKSQITLFSQSTAVFRTIETGLGKIKDILGMMKDVDIPSELVDMLVGDTTDILNTSKMAQENTQKQAKILYDDVLVDNKRAKEILGLLAEG